MNGSHSAHANKGKQRTESKTEQQANIKQTTIKLQPNKNTKQSKNKQTTRHKTQQTQQTDQT